MTTLKILWEIMYKNKILFLVSIFFILLSTLFSMMLPIILKFIIDFVLQDNSSSIPSFIVNYFNEDKLAFVRNNLWIFVIIIILCAVLEGLFIFLNGFISSKAYEDISKNLKEKLFLHIQKLPYIYHLNSNAGDIIQRCTSDVETVRSFYEKEIREMSKSTFIIIISIVVLCNLNSKLALVSFITLPFIFIFSLYFFVKLGAIFFDFQVKEAELVTVLQENLSGIRVVKSFGNQICETKKFDKKNLEYNHLLKKLFKSHAVFWSLSDFICYIQIGIVLFYGIYMIYNDEMSLGTLLVFYAYTNMLVWPIRRLGESLGEVGKVKVSINRIYEILNVKTEEDTVQTNSPELNGDIVFENVSFEYIKGIKVLHDINMVIRKGETVGILGTTGAGKSTIVLLILRLLDLTSGSIKINGNELKTINKDWLRTKIGIVLQEPFLFSRTIKDNIKMADKDASLEEIYRVTKIAHVHNTIEKFEKGYDTIVGEKGVTLSGGQKQRIAVARTLIKNSDIFIFDDSLSAVDTETDLNIRKALKQNNKTTTIIISQRITTLMQADKIYVMESGKITDCGTHDELINKDCLYSKIWKIQSKMHYD